MPEFRWPNISLSAFLAVFGVALMILLAGFFEYLTTRERLNSAADSTGWRCIYLAMGEELCCPASTQPRGEGVIDDSRCEKRWNHKGPYFR